MAEIGRITEYAQAVGGKMPTRWGIVTAGKISHDFVTALSTLPSEDHEVVAVAARQMDRAQEFATRHRIPRAYDSYEELAVDENVEVVYIGSIHPCHFPLAKLMIDHGKHVLVEKPLCMNLKESCQLIQLAQSRKVFLMEALWSRFLPAYDSLKKELEAETIGEVLQVVVSFGQEIQHIDRMRLKELGGGTILDIGIYCVQFATFVFGNSQPKEIVALGHLNEHGVDESMNAIFRYSDGKLATLASHSRVDLPNEGLIIGTKGTIKVSSPFWAPTNLITPGRTRDFYLPTASQPFNFVNSAGLRYEAMEVRRCLLQGLLESPKMPHSESLLIADLMDQLKAKLGVVYPEDLHSNEKMGLRYESFK